MREIFLHGDLGRRFGHRFVLDVRSPAEAVRALMVQLRGFRDAIGQGEWCLFRGDRPLGPEHLHFGLGRKAFHIFPKVEGAKRGGVLQVVIGVVIIAAAIALAYAAAPAAGAAFGKVMAAETGIAIFGQAVTYAGIAKVGLAIALTGIASMLAPQPKVPGGSEGFKPADERASFLFTGAVNSAVQGGVVPVVFGRYRIGSTVVAGSIRTQDYIGPLTLQSPPVGVGLISFGAIQSA